MEQSTFRLKKGQAYTFKVGRAAQVTFGRVGAARFTVTVADPALEDKPKEKKPASKSKNEDKT